MIAYEVSVILACAQQSDFFTDRDDYVSQKNKK
jgi:hypothetical protein